MGRGLITAYALRRLEPRVTLFMNSGMEMTLEEAIGYVASNELIEVNNAFRSGMMFSVIDKRMGSYPSECVERFLSLALKCCQENTDSRLSMTEVVHELKFRTSSTFSIYDAPLVS
ncbi:putative LRR receptor-like serine/threonine-protein kinase At1g06840 [Apium graveolens]|uniref:putative LRR receptor-like serine/threonine-protein kinase At1g06840 n=1 Tax=Apium graveolens TaxID=4045 RepID=UPI003D799FF9